MSSITIFHHTIGPGTAIGKILSHLALELAEQGYDVTLFSSRYDPSLKHVRIRQIRVPSVKRPLFLLFITYHLCSLMIYLWNRYIKGKHWDVRIGIESNFLFPDVCYAHFCHRGYLEREWNQVKARIPGWLRASRWLNRKFRALLEPFVYKRAQWIVVPSYGLKQEITEEYPFARHKIEIIPNFIDPEKMCPPSDFDRQRFRKSLGFQESDIVAVFCALGEFEHKGLHLILEALRSLPSHFKLLVIGGRNSEIVTWRGRVASAGIAGKVVFVGFRKDIRPYLWSADVFAFPSVKETFSLSVIEAAAAGLPLIVSQLYVVEEFMEDKQMGYVVERNAQAIEEALLKFSQLSSYERLKMGQRAQDAVKKKYEPQAFLERWHEFLKHIVETTDERA